jgi:protein-glutamine gamma-glutamyltransferase
MKTPPLLLGAALAFWGWQTGLLWLGLAAGVLLELPHLTSARWAFSQADLDRVWNLCVALFLGATILAFFSGDNLTALGDLFKDNSPSSRLATLNQSKRSLFQLLQWLPLMFLPMLLAQAFGEQAQFDLSTFSWWLRRQRAAPDYAARYAQGLNLCYPYFACCVFSASAANQRSAWFSAGLLGLVIWPLWLNRSRSFRPAAWIGCLLLALILGVATQLGMLEVQKLLQRLDEALLARWSSGRMVDARQNQTHLGAIGALKLSGRIVLRVDSDGKPPPALLREASYDLFQAPHWSASKRDFERLTPETNQGTWVLRPAHGPAHSAKIAGSMPGGAGLLPLPSGFARLDGLPAFEAFTNAFGAVRVEDGPGFVEFQTTYDSSASVDSEPGPQDHEVPATERAAVRQIAEELRLQDLPVPDAVRAVEAFFANSFTYSTWQGPQHRAGGTGTALTRFLLENRSGHCEYFATATTLLLRAAGIPARYAIGWAVQERKGRYYVVRERHAHAWCLAWINGVWRNVDTTPGTWLAAETERASPWEPIADLFSRMWFEFSRWRWGHAEWKGYLLWLIGPLLALALARVLYQRQWTRSRSDRHSAQAAALWPGLDSEFYAGERRLTSLGLGRQPGETGSAWLQRLRQTATVSVEDLEVLLKVHYRLRFDPGGLEGTQRLQFRQRTEAWLSRW